MFLLCDMLCNSSCVLQHVTFESVVDDIVALNPHIDRGLVSTLTPCGVLSSVNPL